jgi:hypothetical protein
MAKAGFDRPMGEQTAEVLKITQTTASASPRWRACS